MHLEQINATRLIKQLKGLIYEIDMLRSQVQDSDLQKFDSLTDQARKDAQDAIKEYLGKKSKDFRLSGGNFLLRIKKMVYGLEML
jgi:syntaxin 17